MKYLIIGLVFLSGCATLTPLERKQANVLNCVKDLKQNDSGTMDSFEICRQVYGLRKVRDDQ